MARITPCLENGKVAQLPDDVGLVGGSTEFITLRRMEEVDADYLFFLATDPELHARAVSLMTGTTGRRRLAAKDLAQLTVELPPLETQRELAAALDVVQGAGAAARRHIAAGRGLLSRLTDHLLTPTAAGDESNVDWRITVLGDVCDIRSGITKGRRAKGPTYPVAFLRAANVQHGELNLAEMHEFEVTEVEQERFVLRNGDVLMTEGGNREDVGRGWLWSGEVEACVHQNHVFAVRPRDNVELSSRFLAYAITTSAARRHCLAHARQTSNLATLNKTNVSAMPVAIPPSAVQLKMVESLDAVRRVIEAARASDWSYWELRESLSLSLMRQPELLAAA